MIKKLQLIMKQPVLDFPAVEVEAADWELQLNCHCIASKEVCGKYPN